MAKRRSSVAAGTIHGPGPCLRTHSGGRARRCSSWSRAARHCSPCRRCGGPGRHTRGCASACTRCCTRTTCSTLSTRRPLWATKHRHVGTPFSTASGRVPQCRMSPAAAWCLCPSRGFCKPSGNFIPANPALLCLYRHLQFFQVSSDWKMLQTGLLSPCLLGEHQENGWTMQPRGRAEWARFLNPPYLGRGWCRWFSGKAAHRRRSHHSAARGWCTSGCASASLGHSGCCKETTQTRWTSHRSLQEEMENVNTSTEPSSAGTGAKPRFTGSSVLSSSATVRNSSPSQKPNHNTPSHVTHPMHKMLKPILVLFPLCKYFCVWTQQIFGFIAKFSQIQLFGCFQSQSNLAGSNLHSPSYST